MKVFLHLCMKLWLITLEDEMVENKLCISQTVKRGKKCGAAYGHRSDGCWFIVCGVSCGYRAGVTDKILTREDIYACVFIYTRQASVVKEVLWTDSLRRRFVFTQLGSVLFLIHSPYGAYARSHWTPLQSTANLHSVARGLPADKWPGGEVQGESCQSQSALCCCSNLRRCRGGVRDRQDFHKIYP